MTWTPTPESDRLTQPKKFKYPHLVGTVSTSTGHNVHKTFHFFRWLLLALLVGTVLWLSGCTKNEESIIEPEEISFWNNTSVKDIIDSVEKTKELEAKLQRLEDYLEVVEWIEYDECTGDEEVNRKLVAVPTQGTIKIKWLCPR